MKIFIFVLLLCANTWGSYDESNNVLAQTSKQTSVCFESLPIREPLDDEKQKSLLGFFVNYDAAYQKGLVDIVNSILNPEQKLDFLDYYNLLLIAGNEDSLGWAEHVLIEAAKATRANKNFSEDNLVEEMIKICSIEFAQEEQCNFHT